jgi:cystathionine beta-synthase
LSGTVVTPVADGGEKYLGSVFDDEWMAKRDLLDPTIAAQLDTWLPARARAA